MADFKQLEQIAIDDVQVLGEKAIAYGNSWKKRGGVGAFMMLARKWDRIENMTTACGYDIFKAVQKNGGKDGLLDDIADLRRYLLLVEEHVTAADGEATSAYVNQDVPSLYE